MATGPATIPQLTLFPLQLAGTTPKGPTAITPAVGSPKEEPSFTPSASYYLGISVDGSPGYGFTRQGVTNLSLKSGTNPPSLSEIYSGKLEFGVDIDVTKWLLMKGTGMLNLTRSFQNSTTPGQMTTDGQMTGEIDGKICGIAKWGNKIPILAELKAGTMEPRLCLWSGIGGGNLGAHLFLSGGVSAGLNIIRLGIFTLSTYVGADGRTDGTYATILGGTLEFQLGEANKKPEEDKGKKVIDADLSRLTP